MSSSSNSIISVCSTETFQLDFDLFCCCANEHHQYHKMFAHYQHQIMFGSIQIFEGGLAERRGTINFLSAKGGNWSRGFKG